MFSRAREMEAIRASRSASNVLARAAAAGSSARANKATADGTDGVCRAAAAVNAAPADGGGGGKVAVGAPGLLGTEKKGFALPPASAPGLDGVVGRKPEAADDSNETGATRGAWRPAAAAADAA
jgi:hypothetical protein